MANDRKLDGRILRQRSVILTCYPRWVLWFACALVVVANVFNIGADLGGMADAMQMVTGVHAYYWTPFFALLVMTFILWTSYSTMARVFKWLTLVLFAYVITAFLAASDLERCTSRDVFPSSRME
jgi:Mn2+/Fe2+ NRAMP family transporter